MTTQVSPEVRDDDQFDPPMSCQQWMETVWRENQDVLPAGVCNRLRILDECIFGIGTLTEMLRHDADMRVMAKHEEFDYTPMPEHQRHGLGNALSVLLREAAGTMEGLRHREWVPRAAAAEDASS